MHERDAGALHCHIGARAHRDPDLRLGKNLRFGRSRALVALDIFNLFNSNTPDVYQQTYPSALNPLPVYLNPLSITVGRFFKISAQLDF